MRAPVFHNPALEELCARGHYTSAHLDTIERELARHGTLRMRPLASGLFPAADVMGAAVRSGYRNAWVRDNAWVAYAHDVLGAKKAAARTVGALLRFFHRHRARFEAIIAGDVDPDDVMLRPHIRFEARTLRELGAEPWSHAQNDALGYALWMASRLLSAGALEPDARMVRMLCLFPRYFEAIRYWQDEDSGHWEELRKCSASSIGVVVAGLEALLSLLLAQGSKLRRLGFDAGLEERAGVLVEQGRRALAQTLPAECVSLDASKNRRYDAALLFLVHPLGVVQGPLAELILADIERYLTGEHGVRRYLGDSYWAPDYGERFRESEQTASVRDDMAARDALLDSIGHEAQWCIFDPVISAHYGERYRSTRARADLDRQAHHLERSLAQITGDFQCPELYYRSNGRYVANPHTPLLWAQANLSVALSSMRESARLALERRAKTAQRKGKKIRGGAPRRR